MYALLLQLDLVASREKILSSKFLAWVLNYKLVWYTSSEFEQRTITFTSYWWIKYHIISMEILCLLVNYPVIRRFLANRGDSLSMHRERRRGDYMCQATDIRFGHRLYCNIKTTNSFCRYHYDLKKVIWILYHDIEKTNNGSFDGLFLRTLNTMMFYRHNSGNHGHQMWAVRRYGSHLAKLTGLSQREVHSIMSDFLLDHIKPIIHNTTVQITFIFIGQTHLDFGKRVCTCATKH